ncbi:phenylalanine--tRNA ligase subunit beta, partial [Nostocoides japonicum]|uniref:phenylalanine--tRNA ligase subunit beta n=1 Tax=Nostocoides japonicum TaxID=99481 RepID=UPI00069D208B
MYVPVTWLRDLVAVDPSATGHDIAESLVEVGLEEEGISGGEVAGPLVVGRVLSAEPEPQRNGKTINWCQVDVGPANGTGQPQGIVCGAHNFAAGDLVAVILPGGVLPGGFEIGARRTYGHVSAGMICSERELGLGDNHEGIIVLGEYLADRPDILAALTPGQDLIPVLGLGDEVLEVNITPDRGYCFSMRGIAREYALATGVAYEDPAGLPVPPANGEGYAIRLDDDAPIDGATGCDRYVARIVRGVDVTASSPSWMQQRLRDMGMRPISLAVDVTNYVMLLLGQPLHAFDLETLSGSIVVRRARRGETLTTLDDVERTLHPEDLLITDGGTVPLALAGVMGGETSEVSAATTDVLIEAAHFDPVTVARTSRRHRLSTEASKRFERGVDPELAPVAAQLAVDLLVEHGGGTPDGGVTDVDLGIPRHAYDFDTTLPSRYIGLEYSREEVLRTLAAVGCAVAEEDGDVVSVRPPSWRPDLVDGPDLVEEVARVHGYDAIPSVVAVHGGRGLTHAQRSRRLVANTLAGQGLCEVQTFPFVSEQLYARLGYADDDARRRTVRVTNPLSDEAPLLRTSVLDTLLDALRRNVARGTRDVAVYEVARVVAGLGAGAAPLVGIERRPDDETLAAILDAVPPQPFHVGFAATGEAERGGPWGPSRRYDPSDAVAWAR